MNKSNSGISFTGALLLVFVTLKLTGNIDWDWVWVLSPVAAFLDIRGLFRLLADRRQRRKKHGF